MKKDLLGLIERAELLKRKFHIVSMPDLTVNNCIYDVPEFCIWKEELQTELESLYEIVHDEYIYQLLINIKKSFTGKNDDQDFFCVVQQIKKIKNNIDKYYPKEVDCILSRNDKTPKLFISHSSKDKEYVRSFIRLLEDIGIGEKSIFCSSMPNYGVKLEGEIYEVLKTQFLSYDLHMIYMLSDNYYNSVACLNEMGAAWVLQKRYTTILLPGFEFKQIKGAVNPNRIGIELDDVDEVNERLGELKDNLIKEFEINSLSHAKWERKRNDFLDAIKK